MGIPNLLKFLKPFFVPVHIKKYSGKRVGIDAYSWLHRGAYSCSMELCLEPQSEAARRYLKYFMHHINLLRHYNVVPVVVFDGGNIPSKASTESMRQRRREESLVLAKEKLQEQNVAAAIEYFKKTVQITPSMAHELIKILRSEGVEFIVAPYEADAQLAFLSTLDSDHGGIDAIISEDSDLIAYGCPSIIFKMDRFGKGEEFSMDRVFLTVSNGLSFSNWDKDIFTGMCVLAGCDFVPSIVGIGPKRAYSLVSKYKNLNHVLSALKLDSRYNVPENYSNSFWSALSVFHHARVYNVQTKALESLNPLVEPYITYLDGNLDLLGPELPPSSAVAIAEGHVNPITLEPFDELLTTGSLDKLKKQPVPHRVDPHDFQPRLSGDSELAIFSPETMEDIADHNFDVRKHKYEKEALALCKLVSVPAVSSSIANEDEKNQLPDNNPFKKRKLDDINLGSPMASLDDSMLASVHTLECSSMLQGIIKSTPKRIFSDEKTKPGKKKVQKSSNKNAKRDVDEKNGILKFLFRL